jgi:hypothetical protein
VARSWNIIAVALFATLTVTAVALAAARPTLTVKSTLDGKAVLPLRIHWIVTANVPASNIASVSYLIDGKLGWVEHNPPYVYASDGNWLVTSFLSAGEHTFTARVLEKSGLSATDTIRAKVVAPPPPPAELAGTWRRTPANVKPAGAWQVTITPNGWMMRDPQGGGGIFDVRYLSATRIEMRPTIEHPPYPSPNNGGWCDDTDPLSVYRVSVASDGSTMTIGPADGHDPCQNRAGVMAGTWTRVR